MKPTIGVTSNLNDQLLTLSMDNIDALTESGAVPIVVPNYLVEENINQLIEKIDGLLVTGGGDIDPTLFGEEPHQHLGSICPERDSFEMSIITKMLDHNKPVLGICRGCQILAIAAGGDMYQDIYFQMEGEILQHSQKAPRWHASHFVSVKKDTLLYKIVQTDRIKVNSFHHQAVRELPKEFEVSAISNDSVIEAFESKKHSFVLGVQWHPECLTEKHDKPSLLIFQHFVNACKNKKDV
ncbi:MULTISPECIES: gamma-glutamyl-gamma-aminobutyrate hydrolase family protein [Cytobacillus]|uniref:Gamma-glutamyl-gamma-aminobutyrate hydrolase n=1 Tax=Cytobacillus oceanisediminis TaxID=665099 RepID=A0ABX3CN54_9BACI|nr:MULTISPECIES: gamma-glutamyl-gamma-aminobutyrate hydrolase family protein [Cytobacillus]OHX44674.1 gamma-glutamyl-gamma-aminobutyrate hydrolase [Cytobacillus oceanisediminis]